MTNYNPQSSKRTDSAVKKFVSSKSVRSKLDIPEGVEETEIVADVTLPSEGGWGWVVTFASFLCIFILDGIFFTFGCIYKSMTDDFQIDGTLVALVNSIALALYFICGPLASALVNRFGFRACAMSGSIILSLSYLCSYFVTSFAALVLFYGAIAGAAASLVVVPSSVVVGFYFERNRALALTLSGLGSSLGVMVMSSANSYLVQLAGWRIVTLIHSGLFGLIYFIAMTYRPLLVVKFTQTTETTDPTRTVTYLPSIVTKPGVPPGKAKKEGVESTATERLFSAVSSPNFPTAISVLQEGTKLDTSQVGPSSQAVSKLKILARNASGNVSRKQLSRIQSVVSSQKDNVNVQVTVEADEKEPIRKWWARFCCKWEKHVDEFRPMYRDDAFYAGKIEDLPVYHKSVLEVQPEARTGLEYSMAVTRAATAADVEERKGVFTTAVRRVLATMMDPQLLKSLPFLLICCSSTLTYLGLLTPFVFVTDRARTEGIDEKHCNLFVSVMGFAGLVGRICAGILVYKINALLLYLLAFLFAGVAIMAFNLSFNVYYYYFCCIFFGFSIALGSGLRSLVLVQCYGLEKLTNTTGMVLMSSGFGTLLSTPLSGILKSNFSYDVSFYVAGIAMILSSLLLMPVKKLRAKEISEQVVKQTK